MYLEHQVIGAVVILRTLHYTFYTEDFLTLNLNATRENIQLHLRLIDHCSNINMGRYGKIIPNQIKTILQ